MTQSSLAAPSGGGHDKVCSSAPIQVPSCITVLEAVPMQGTLYDLTSPREPTAHGQRRLQRILSL